MCGRTCCSLQPDVLALACTTVTSGRRVPKLEGQLPVAAGKPEEVSNKNSVSQDNYHPSTNVAPTSKTPVLVDCSKLGDQELSQSLKVMTWGMIPPWFRGPDPTKHGLSTNNARLENLEESKLYKPALMQGNRCVVICDGFYEWKSLKDKGKQPYLVYSTQPTSSDGKSKLLSNQSKVRASDVWVEGRGYVGQRPLFMAGIYSRWKAAEQPPNHQSAEVYSYSIITRDSTGILDWLHDRMPVILPDSEAVEKWLDPNVKEIEALKHIKQISKDQVSYHPVSGAVGNSRDQSESLMEPAELDGAGKAKDKSTKRSAGLMANWLAKKPKQS